MNIVVISIVSMGYLSASLASASLARNLRNLNTWECAKLASMKKSCNYIVWVDLVHFCNELFVSIVSIGCLSASLASASLSSILWNFKYSGICKFGKYDKYPLHFSALYIVGVSNISMGYLSASLANASLARIQKKIYYSCNWEF